MQRPVPAGPPPVPRLPPWAALLGGLLVAGCTGASAPVDPVGSVVQDDRPDIVLVVIDTLRADRLGCLGNPRPASPAIDAMAAEGLLFTRAHAQSGWTLPAFTSLFTGQLPHAHRVGRAPEDGTRFGRLPPEATTLAEALGAAGYATGAVMNNTFLAPEFGLHQGFAHYDWAGATVDAHRSADQAVDDALGWLGAQQGPAFLVVHLMEPHADYAPPDWARAALPDPPGTDLPPAVSEGWLRAAVAEGRLDPAGPDREAVLARYDAELRVADRAVGALRAGLAARGRPVFTALTADHGEEFWDHGGFEHGHALWSELTRVPLVLRGPGVPKNARNDTVVEHVDLVRGIAAATGAQLDPAVGGVSIFDVASGPPLPRTALSENCLYGPSCVSITDGQRRFLLQHQLVFPEGAGRDLAQAKVRPVADVFPILPSGLEGPRMARAEAEAVAPGYARMLEAKRGSLAPLAARDGAAVPDFQTFQMLKELGYVDRPDAAAQPQTPCR